MLAVYGPSTDADYQVRLTEALHELDVLRVPMIEVVRHVSVVPVVRAAGRVGEGVPDAGAAPALVHSALYLCQGVASQLVLPFMACQSRLLTANAQGKEDVPHGSRVQCLS